MVVIVLEKVPAALRGELTRWMLELRAGVFVGTVSALVRDRLWEKVRAKSKTGGYLMVHSAQNEQGFEIRHGGDTSYEIHDWEGLKLVSVPKPQ